MLLRTSILSIVLAMHCISLSGQEFTCDGTFYINTYPGVPPTTVYEITTSGGINFVSLFDVPITLNATGLNSVDKNIYGVNVFSDNEIYRVEADGTITSVFVENELTTFSAAAGAINNNGVYGVHDRNMDMIFLYQTGATVTKLGSSTLFWDSSTGNTGIFNHDIDDLVYDPFDDSVMYTYQRFYQGPVPTRGHLLRVNVDMDSPDFGMVSSVGLLDPNEVVHMGALFFDTNGALHGYGSQVSAPVQQNRLFKINQNDASLVLLGIGPQASGVDGCSCRNPLKLEKTVKLLETTCDSNYLKYTISMENLSMLNSIDLKLKDSLIFDGIITSMNLGSDVQTANISGGIGSNFVIFENFNISGSATESLELYVSTDLQNVEVSNQARLYEIGVATPIDSDDPMTMAISDPTLIFLPDFLSSSETEFNEAICPGDSVVINGVSYTEGGMFDQSIETSEGCDSTLLINITVLEESSETLQFSICEGDQVEVNNEVYSTEGTYVQDLKNTEGCDSTLHILVNVLSNSVSIIDEELCEGDIIIINGAEYGNSGSYEQVIVNADGCDSLISITVQVQESVNGALTVNLCPGEVYELNGESYSDVGEYQQMLTSNAGCDSLLTIEIDQLASSESMTSLDLCNGDEVVINGQTYSEPGNYEQMLINVVGCDSIVMIEINGLHPSSRTEDIELCGGEEIVINDVVYNVQGSFNQLFTNSVGCDSTLVLNITLDDTCIDCEDFSGSHKIELKIVKEEIFAIITIDVEDVNITIDNVKYDNVETFLLHFVSLKSNGLNLDQLDSYSAEKLKDFPLESFLELKANEKSKISKKYNNLRSSILEDFDNLRVGSAISIY